MSIKSSFKRLLSQLKVKSNEYSKCPRCKGSGGHDGCDGSYFISCGVCCGEGKVKK